MSKVTIIGATGNVGMFAAYAISANPHVHEIRLYGREGRESLLKGIAQDFIDSFAARGTISGSPGRPASRTWPVPTWWLLLQVLPAARDRTVSIWRSGMPALLRLWHRQSEPLHLIQRSSW